MCQYISISITKPPVAGLVTITITTACRSILAGATSLVDSVNASSGDAWTSVQCDEQLAANSNAAYKFLEDFEMSTINHELMQL